MTSRSRFAAVVVATVAAALGACNSSSGSMNDGMNSAPFDQQFIDMMVPHHQGAAMMAMTALDRAEHPALKAMAGEVMSAQNHEIDEMKGWRKQWYGSDATPTIDHMPMLPGMTNGPMMNMTKMNNELKTANPFDRAFIDDMIPHHKMAIDAARIAQQKAEHAEIKQLAANIIVSQQKEIDQMKQWRAEWYPGN